jgi:hypothetical protein
MHPLLTKRIEIPWSHVRIPWSHVRKIVAIIFAVVAVAIVLYVLSAPPIIKAIWQAQIKQTHRPYWPVFYAPLLIGLESNSAVIHGPLRWYFNGVWGCGIIFFSDVPPGQDHD